MLRPALLVVVAVCLCAGVMGSSVSHEQEHDGGCHYEQVHLHIHGDMTGEHHVHFHLHGDGDHREHHDEHSSSSSEDHDDHSGDHHDGHSAEHHDEHSGNHTEFDHDEHDMVYAHCAMHSDVTTAVHGHVFITQHTHDEHAEIEVDVFELPIHNEDVHLTVYDHGDVSDGCSSLVGHHELGHADVGTTDGTGEIDTTLGHHEFSVKGLHSIMGRPVSIDGTDHVPMACCMVSWSSSEEHHEELEKDHEEAREHHKDDAHVGRRRKRSAVHPKLLAQYL